MKPATWKPSTSSSIISNSQFLNDGPYDVPANFPTQCTSSAVVYDKGYVERLRKTFHAEQNERKSVRHNEKLGCETGHIRQRLKEHAYPCDLKTLTCLAGRCGRSFDRIQVLAFHLSYAHQDLMTATADDSTCLLCGRKWMTVRRKINHLSLAHREVGEEHNSQCMLQVDSVIAPNAPKAQRLEKARLIYGDRLTDQFDEADTFLNPEDDLDDEYSYSG
ncbi:unnamed protein product [Caenorhabditis nigoni]|uniref:C2H2-type domain-containing protein n=1 Tax=Caenorhabditis nigoni TaxID=1611254 RepID=A0A2G5UEV6_9PELO|nr:hypothetical protein B9Z55_010221 [Caenorhabditis nigoni]